MMFKRYVIVGFILIVTVASSASAGGLDGMYLGVKGIYSHHESSDPILKWDGNSWRFDDKSDGAVGGGLAIGYDFDKRFTLPLRVELEYAMREEVEPSWTGNQGIFVSYPLNWKLEVETEVDTLLVNLYYDFKNRTSFTPYVGAGAGNSFIDWKSHYTDDGGMTPISANGEVTEFAWSIALGGSYAVTDAFMVDLGYRYVDAGTAEAEYQPLTSETDIELHEVVLGVRYAF